MFVRIVHWNSDGSQKYISYVKEENIANINGSIMDEHGFNVNKRTIEVLLKKEGVYLGMGVHELQDGSPVIVNVSNISYPTTSNVEIDSVSVNQHTDISNLSSVLNKLDETLNKILDKEE